MTESGPEERCGFVLEREDAAVPQMVTGDEQEYQADIVNAQNYWYEKSNAVCCWRPIWGETDRCIWHAEVDGKPVSELMEARKASPERFDGAYLTDVAVDNQISFNECSFFGGDLSNSSFWDCDFSSANLAAADASNTVFWDASLSEAYLGESDLAGSNFRWANLSGAKLAAANLEGAEFTDSNLSRVDFRHAKISETSFRNANLTGVEFSETDLTGSDFQGADLTTAILFGVNLSDTNLFNARMIGAELYAAELTGVQINRHTEFGRHYDEGRPAGRTRSLLDRLTPPYPSLSRLTPPHPTKQWLLSEADDSYQRNLRRAAWSYRQAENLSREHGFSKQARDLNYLRKEIRRKQYLVDEEDRSIFHWVLATASSTVMCHGESPARVVLVSLLVILGSALLYPLQLIGGLRLTANSNQIITYTDGAGVPDLLGIFGQSVYFSTVTFTTVGYGDIQPVAYSQALATVESFLGALLMALLVFVLGRRATW